MFELEIADKDLLSHAYLDNLIVEQGLSDFALTGNTLNSAKKITDAHISSNKSVSFDKVSEHSKLVIFTEGLQLNQLSLITLALANIVELAFYRVIKVKGVNGFAICAYVTLQTQDNLSSQFLDTQFINNELETMANRFCVELCLVGNTPSLQKPGLLLMDMDSTVIAVECIDEIAELAGVGEQVSAVTAQAMQGKLDFAQSLRTRVACLADADETILGQVRDALPLMPGVANLVNLLKTYDWKVAIASGGFTYFADCLQDRLNLDAAVANELEIIDGKLTGKVQGAIIDANVKAQTLNRLANEWSISLDQTIAMGDGANDLVMMTAAALGVALHAKPVVREKADIAIRRGSLDSLLWVLSAGQS